MNLYILKFRLLQHGQVAVQAKDPTEAHRLMELAWRRKYGDFPSPVKSYEVIAEDGDTSGTWLIAAPPADAEKDARIAALERKIAELTYQTEAETKRAQEAERERNKFSADLCDEVWRKCELERKLAELTGAAEPCSKSPPGASALCKLRTVLAAQRGEKEEAKP